MLNDSEQSRQAKQEMLNNSVQIRSNPLVTADLWLLVLVHRKQKVPVSLLEHRLDKVRAEKSKLEACTVSEGDAHYLLFEA